MPGGDPLKILVVDDDVVSRPTMQRKLKRFGYEVLLTEKSRAAAEILSRADSARLALIHWRCLGYVSVDAALGSTATAFSLFNAFTEPRRPGTASARC